MDINSTEKNRCTALVVDDDEDTINLFAEFLEIYNIDVIGKASDGKQAIKIYRDMSPDIVFSDVMMPEYDGFYALASIKKINPKAIMIMITGDVRSETINELKRLNADAIIYKPFDMKEVMKTVDKLMTNTVCQSLT